MSFSSGDILSKQDIEKWVPLSMRIGDNYAPRPELDLVQRRDSAYSISSKMCFYKNKEKERL